MDNGEIKLSKRLQDIANSLDDEIEKITGKRMAFSLVVFNDKPGGRMQYISNCERTSASRALKSLVSGWDKGMPDIKSHEVQ